VSTTKELKEYLINEDDGFLLNPDNNGKTIMLSGAWGSGKTHFWQNEVSPKLKEKQTNIYVSLYGKESIDEIRFDILKEAYNSQVKENFISKSASLLSRIAPSFGEKSLTDGFEKLNKEAKGKKATEILQLGSVICLDDFERKSKKVDLNDLFGFISQLAIDMHCKIVIILNSDVFDGEEANVFKNVKEKTVNKFFYFEPTIEDLFYSIANDEKYNPLDNYKKEILKVIEETEEINARIYIQVLDNCLEWIEKGYDASSITTLILSTIFFIKNHEVLNYRIAKKDKKQYSIVTYFLDEGYYDIAGFLQNTAPQLFSSDKTCACKESIQMMNNHLNKSKKEDKELKSDDYYKRQNKIFDENKNFFRDFIFYVYVLKIDDRISQNEFEKINEFVKTGILSKQTKEVETLVPP